MRKLLVPAIIFSSLALGVYFADAQMRRGFQNISLSSTEIAEHTAKGEADGKAVWEKLQAKTLSCENLSAEDFENLGEYFMGQMMGDAHAAMNEMMIRMMGEQGESQMHIVMGKRLSGCDTTAAWPQSGIGFAPMMPMMTGWGSGGWGMMGNWWGGVGAFAALVAFLWTTVLPLAVLALLVLWIVKLWKQIKK